MEVSSLLSCQSLRTVQERSGFRSHQPRDDAKQSWRRKESRAILIFTSQGNGRQPQGGASVSMHPEKCDALFLSKEGLAFGEGMQLSCQLLQSSERRGLKDDHLLSSGLDKAVLESSCLCVCVHEF